MLTPQEITEKAFVRAIIGGYDMSGVDEFLEKVTVDYTALYKENAILKGKLKVLVEKVEEYRSTEDSMRMALLTAQRVGEEITAEANKQREAVLRDAGAEIKARLANTAQRITEEETRLSVAAKETSKFIELSLALMRRHSEFLSKIEAARRAVIPDKEPPPPPPPAQEKHIVDVADQIGDAVQRLTDSDPTVPSQATRATYNPLDQVAPSFTQPFAPQPTAQAFAQPATPQPVAQPFVQPVAQPFAQPAAQPFAQPAAPLPATLPFAQPAVPQPAAAPPLYDIDSAPTMPFSAIGDEDSTSPRPKFDFDDLKFGANFESGR